MTYPTYPETEFRKWFEIALGHTGSFTKLARVTKLSRSTIYKMYKSGGKGCNFGKCLMLVKYAKEVSLKKEFQ